MMTCGSGGQRGGERVGGSASEWQALAARRGRRTQLCICSHAARRAPAPAHLEAHDDDPHHPEDVGGEEALEHVQLVLHLARVDHVEQLLGMWGTWGERREAAHMAVHSGSLAKLASSPSTTWPPTHMHLLPTQLRCSVCPHLAEDEGVEHHGGDILLAGLLVVLPVLVQLRSREEEKEVAAADQPWGEVAGQPRRIGCAKLHCVCWHAAARAGCFATARKAGAADARHPRSAGWSPSC